MFLFTTLMAESPFSWFCNGGNTNRLLFDSATTVLPSLYLDGLEKLFTVAACETLTHPCLSNYSSECWAAINSILMSLCFTSKTVVTAGTFFRFMAACPRFFCIAHSYSGFYIDPNYFSSVQFKQSWFWSTVAVCLPRHKD